MGRNAIAFLGFLLVGAGAPGVPRASLTARTWQLEVTFHDPQRITVHLPAGEYPQTVWYLLYEVTNHTGRDVEFYPSFHVVTDILQVVEGGEGIHPAVYDAIAARHREEFPFLAPPPKVTGLLLQGSENARASVAVFRTIDLEASGFTIYGSGFSGDVDQMANPAFDPQQEVSDANARSFVLRRTLAVSYLLPGDPETRRLATPVRIGRQWVMR